MILPNNEVGISDINQWRECPRRFNHQMRRHTEGEPPEDVHPDTMYGTIIHEAVSLAEEEDLSDEEAIQASFDRYGSYLGPDDLTKLRGDLATYRERDYIGVKTIANERELRVPLFVQDGEQFYFRCKIDRLYARLDNPASFIHIDYKSSKWRKSEAEVHKDTQMWAYNWAIHEFWPECEHLSQVYDQLRYGTIPTHKSDAQRAQIKEWLIRQVKAILADETLEPKFNRWCASCSIREDCPIIPRLTNVEKARIEALLPPDQNPDPSKLKTYVDQLEGAEQAAKTLEAYSKRIRAMVRELPAHEREALGFKLAPVQRDVWSSEALAAAHSILGEDFYAVTSMAKKRVKEYLDADDRLERVLALAEKVEGSPRMTRS